MDCIVTVLESSTTAMLLRLNGLTLLQDIRINGATGTASKADFNVSGVLVLNGYSVADENTQLPQSIQMSEIDAVIQVEVEVCGFRSFSTREYRYLDTPSVSTTVGISTDANATITDPGTNSRVTTKTNEAVVATFTSTPFMPSTVDRMSTAAQRRLSSEQAVMRVYTVSDFEPFPAETRTTSSSRVATGTTIADSRSNNVGIFGGDSDSDNMILIIVLASVATLALILACAFLIWCSCCRKKKRSKKVGSRSLDTATNSDADEAKALELPSSTTFRSIREETKEPQPPVEQGQPEFEQSEILANCVPAEWLRTFKPSPSRSNVFMRQ